jgi:hypothetical protein
MGHFPLYLECHRHPQPMNAGQMLGTGMPSGQGAMPLKHGSTAPEHGAMGPEQLAKVGQQIRNRKRPVATPARRKFDESANVQHGRRTR